MAETKTDAENFTGIMSAGQSKLFGAGKGNIRASVAAKMRTAEEAAKSSGIARSAAEKQAGAATSAGQKIGAAYGQAQTQLQGATNQAIQATETRHRNALLEARSALANAAMNAQRTRSTGGNLGAAGTMGRQAALQQGQMASAMGQEVSNLRLGSAQQQGQLGIQQAQAQGQMDLQAAGITAAGMKESQALNLASLESMEQAILANAEADGVEFAMNEQQMANFKNEVDTMLSEISTANQQSPQEGIIQAQAYLSQLDLSNPADKTKFELIFNQGMVGIDGMEPNSGMWNMDQALALANAFGPKEALGMMAMARDWIAAYSSPEYGIEMNPATIQAVLQRVIDTGGFGNVGVLYDQGGTLAWADSEGDVPAGGTIITKQQQSVGGQG